MVLSFTRQRCLFFFIAPVLLVALSSCGSSSEDEASPGSVITDTDGDGEEVSESETTDQESSETGVTEPEITDPEVAGPDGDEQGDTDGTNPLDQPNILLVITDDQGIDASAQYSLSLSLIHI